MMRPKPKTPAGVVRSPSCLSSLMPCRRTQAVHGPATWVQHPADFRQSRSSACVAERRGGTTVTSCVAEPMVASTLGNADGQAELCARPPPAETAAQSNAQASSAIVLGIATRLRERGACSALLAEQRQDGEDATVVVLGSREPELLEDRLAVALDCARAQEQLLADR